MDVNFTESFFDSLKKLSRDNMWYMKVINFFRYDLKYYFKNLKAFHKCLWNYRSWNGDNSLMFMEAALKQTGDTIEKYGMEVDESRLKKIEKIRRVCAILNNINEDLYIEIAEKKFGEINADIEFGEPNEQGLSQIKLYKTEEEAKHAHTVFEHSRELEEAEWNELWETLKGQNLTHSMDDDKGYYEKFDGSGLRGWWD